MVDKPKMHNSAAQKELDKAESQLQEFEKQINDLTLDRMNTAPKEEVEPQTKLASSEIAKIPDHYIKPSRSIRSHEKFNERFREDYNFAKEYVNFTAEHKELIGENLEFWTKPFPGVPAEYWVVPTNKPVWAPRYVAEQIKRCNYHRLKMDLRTTVGADFMGSYQGNIVIDTTVQRLDATPVSSRKSVFMGSKAF